MLAFVLPSFARFCIAMKLGIAIAARMPMITTTIISSMRVKPFCDLSIAVFLPIRVARTTPALREADAQLVVNATGVPPARDRSRMLQLVPPLFVVTIGRNGRCHPLDRASVQNHSAPAFGLRNARRSAGPPCNCKQKRAGAVGPRAPGKTGLLAAGELQRETDASHALATATDH